MPQGESESDREVGASTHGDTRRPRGVLHEVMKIHWPYPRRAGEGTLYNFGSRSALGALTWCGPGDGYVVEVVDANEFMDGFRPGWTNAHAAHIGDAWGARTFAGACQSLEVAMVEILESEGAADPYLSII